MPAPLNVNREAVKTLAIAIGVRQAAREMGLEEKTVLGWSHRDNWFPETPKPVSIRGREVSGVKSPSVALADCIATSNEPTRYALAKAHRKAAEHAAELSGEDLMRKDTATALRLHGQGAGLVHNWESKQAPVNVMVNVALLGIDPVQVEAIDVLEAD